MSASKHGKRSGVRLEQLERELLDGRTAEQIQELFGISQRTFYRLLAQGRAKYGNGYGRVLLPSKVRSDFPELPESLDQLDVAALKRLSHAALAQVVALSDDKFSAVRVAAAKVIQDLPEPPVDVDPTVYTPFSPSDAKLLRSAHRHVAFKIGRWVAARLDRLEAGECPEDQRAFDERLLALWVPVARLENTDVSELAAQLESYGEQLFTEAGLAVNLEQDAWRADVERREQDLARREIEHAERVERSAIERADPITRDALRRDRDAQRLAREASKVAVSAVADAKQDRERFSN